MRILHVIPTYLPAYRASGPINLTHGMNKWLVRNGAEVTVYTTAADAPGEQLTVPLRTPVEIDGVTVWYFPLSFPKRWYYSRELHEKLSATIGEFDIIHVTSAFLAVSTIVARLAVRLRKPFIISAYGTFMRAPLRHRSIRKFLYIAFIERWNLAHADALHFATEKERNEYGATGLPAKRTDVIFSGADPEVLKGNANPGSFRAKFKLGEKRCVLSLARLHWIKGYNTLIPAFASVAREDPNVMLVLAGYDDGCYGSEIERMIDAEGIGDRVLLTGPLFKDEKAAAFIDCDLFILVSYTEAASIASIEALFFGLPVVITENCGLAKEIGAAGAGIVVPKETAAVADAIRAVLNDSQRAARMKESARDFFAHELSLDRIAKKFLALYAEVIKDHGARVG